MGVCKLRKTRNQTSQLASVLYADFLRKKECHSFQQVLCIQRGGKMFLLISITAQQQTYDTY